MFRVPRPVTRSIAGTSVVLWACGRALAAAVDVALVDSGGLAPGVAEIWTPLFVLALIWVEIHRRGYRLFLLNMGVPRRALLGVSALTVGAAELVLWLVRAAAGGGA